MRLTVWAAVLALFLAAPAVAAAGWSSPMVAAPTAKGISQAKLAVDAAGGVTAIWTEYNGTNGRVRSAYRPVGGSWGAAVDVSGTGRFASHPDIAIDAAGKVTAVWTLSAANEDRRVESSVRPIGGTWSTPVTLSGAATRASDPVVAVTPAGIATVLYTDDETSSIRRVKWVGRDAGGTWSAPVNLTAASWAAFPELVVSSAGVTTAVWVEDFDSRVLTVSDRTENGAWSQAVPVASGAGGADLAINASGRIAALWADQTGLRSASRPGGGTWRATTPVATGRASNGPPQIALSDAGTAVVVWIAFNSPDGIRVRASTQPSGGTWSPSVLLSDSDNFVSPQVVVDKAGVVTATWGSDPGPGVQASTLPVGGTWSAPVTISAEGNESPDGDTLIVDGNGALTMAWNSYFNTEEETTVRLLASTTGAAPPAPETTITAGPAAEATVATRTPTFQFSGGTSYSCKLDGQATPCASPFTTASLADGRHTFAVAADGDLTPATRAFFVDGTAPTITILTPADGTHFAVGAAAQADWQCDDIGPAGMDVCVGTSLDTSTPGTRTITVTARDKAGNTTTKTIEYVVDAPPVTEPDTTTPATTNPTTTTTTTTPPPVTPQPPPSGDAAINALLRGSRPSVKALLKRGSLSWSLPAESAGALTVELKSGKTVLGKVTQAVTKAGKTTVTLKLTSAGRKLLKQARKPVKVTATATFTPTGGSAARRQAALTLKLR